jgi:hypothetical protein
MYTPPSVSLGDWKLRLAFPPAESVMRIVMKHSADPAAQPTSACRARLTGEGLQRNCAVAKLAAWNGSVYRQGYCLPVMPV